MRITAKGQVTIPQPIRETAGLLPNTEVVFAIEHGKVTISKARAGRPTRGKKVVALLREHFRKVTDARLLREGGDAGEEEEE